MLIIERFYQQRIVSQLGQQTGRDMELKAENNLNVFIPCKSVIHRYDRPDSAGNRERIQVDGGWLGKRQGEQENDRDERIKEGR